jgi:antitoxin (DNA-binding transcriptional repressor) of toxin-antitoxin stability system
MTIHIDAPDAAKQLAQLLNQVKLGEEVVIAEAGVAIARIVPVAQLSTPRVPEQDKGKVIIAPDFDDPLPGFGDAAENAF